MPVHLTRTQVAFDECKNHLHNSNAAGSPVESYLTEHILILLCADMQQALYEIADQRAQRSSDPALRRFVSAAGDRVLRGAGKSEIANFLGMFGPEHKRKFNDSLDDRTVTIYGNAVSQRNQVAHQRGGTIAFMERPDVISAADRILESAEKSFT